MILRAHDEIKTSILSDSSSYILTYTGTIGTFQVTVPYKVVYAIPNSWAPNKEYSAFTATLGNVSDKKNIQTGEKYPFEEKTSFYVGTQNAMAEKETETLGTPGEASLVISHVSKRYGNADHLAVTDFSISLHGGHIYGFLGKNGAGKSTIIKSVVGLHGFEEGTISICGYDVVTQPTEAKMCIGYVPDNYALYENLTGRQYVSYISDLYRVSRKDREARVPDLLKRLEMEAHFNMPMKTYSHGMRAAAKFVFSLFFIY